MAKGKLLEELRREVDTIDDALVDLLARRAEATSAIAQTKVREGGRIPLASAMRPAREAEIIRRLAARHSGEPPLATVVGVMRQILSASLAAQVPFRLHVFAGVPELGEFARAHFGAAATMTRHEHMSRLMNTCAEDADAIAIVPLPENGGDTWWTRLVPAGATGPRVIARLPLVVEGDAPALGAFVVAAIEQEATGDDTTLLLAHVAPSLSRAKLLSQLKEAGIEVRSITSGIPEKRDFNPALLEADGFVTNNDPRLAAFCAQVGIEVAAIVPVGGYANPVRVAAREPVA